MKSAAAATIAAQRQLLYTIAFYSQLTMTLSTLWGALFWYYSHVNGTLNPFLFVLCVANNKAQMHGINDATRPTAERKETTRNQNRYCAHFMTVNSIFNNSKMILWFDIVRGGGGGGNAVRDAKRSDARWKCQLLNILSSQY